MKKRINFLLSYFFLVLALYVCQKPLFMIYNEATTKGASWADFWHVMLHGASLDATMAGYLTAIPFLCVLISIWTKPLPWRKILLPYYVVAAFMMVVTFIVDMGLYPFWGFKLDASIFLYLDSPKQALASVSTGFILVRLVAILVLIAFVTWALWKITPIRLERPALRLRGTGITLLLGGLLFVVIRGGVTESTANVGQVYYSNDPFLNHSAVNPTFSLLSSMSKSKDFSSEFDYFEENKRAELFKGLYPVTDGDSITPVLKTKRPNILLVLMEGFGGVFVEPIGGIKGVSPNLNKLAAEGVFFDHCYANSFRTDRGTVCALSGYLGLPTASVMKIPSKSRTLPAISEELAKVGYHTDFLYGGDINFTNMKSYLLSKDYQHLTSDKDFTLKEQASNAWGVNDDITFDYLLKTLKQRKGDEPWFTTFLTLSSHEPFEVPGHRFDDKILNSFAYTDECIGHFIDGLKKTPVWDNLLVIFVPDHGFRYPREVTDRGGEFSHIPLIWAGGAVKEHKVFSKIMNQTDLAATLLGQLGIDHSRFNFSRNVLGNDYVYPFAFHCWSNGFAYRDSTGVSAYDTGADHLSYEEPEGSAERLNKGKAILQSVYDDLGSR